MSFTNEQIKYMRSAVEIDKMSAEDLLNFDDRFSKYLNRAESLMTE